MNCSQFHSNIFAFSEDALSEELRRSSEEHLALCPSCTLLLSEFREVQQIIEIERAAEPNPFAPTRILQHLEPCLEEAGNPPARSWIRALQPVVLAVALLCGILIGSFSAKQDNAPAIRPVNNSGNIEFLRSNLFISEFADEDKILILNN